MPLLTSLLFILLLLTNPVNSISLVNTGLTTWYKHMIPSLFPFMVLSGFLLRTGMSGQICGIVYPVLGRIFQLSENCIYVIIMGFLCGFPMGASIAADSYVLHKISRREADLLLSFCNNIGPVYFISYAAAACPFYPLWIAMPVMYGIPLLYGLILRYTAYRDIPYYTSCGGRRIVSKKHHCQKSVTPSGCHTYAADGRTDYLTAFQESLQKALISIILLGGYMVIFNVLQLPFYNTFYQLPEQLLSIVKGLMEINSGITAVRGFPRLYPVVYAVFLPFGGLCCIFQTYAVIKDTPLSLRSYLLHKTAQTLCTVLIYMSAGNIIMRG